MEGETERQMGLENLCLFLLSDDSSPRAITSAHRRSDTMSFMFSETSQAHLLKSITYSRKRRQRVSNPSEVSILDSIFILDVIGASNEKAQQKNSSKIMPT